MRKPLSGDWPITQRFGENPADYPKTKGHNGLDWGVPLGTPVFAAEDGLVTTAGMDATGYGLHIRIQSSKYLTIYAHCKELACKRDDRVAAGQLIAYSGSTGWSTGPHLHFEIRTGSSIHTCVDPMLLLDTVDTGPEQKVWATVITTTALRLRSGPGLGHSIVSLLPPGTTLPVYDIAGDIWIRTKGGYCAARYNGDSYVSVVE